MTEDEKLRQAEEIRKELAALERDLALLKDKAQRVGTVLEYVGSTLKTTPELLHSLRGSRHYDGRDPLLYLKDEEFRDTVNLDAILRMTDEIRRVRMRIAELEALLSKVNAR